MLLIKIKALRLEGVQRFRSLPIQAYNMGLDLFRRLKQQDGVQAFSGSILVCALLVLLTQHYS